MMDERFLGMPDNYYRDQIKVNTAVINMLKYLLSISDPDPDIVRSILKDLPEEYTEKYNKL